jgi:hypothetical protein
MLAVTWRGTDAEFDQLRAALAPNCDCTPGLLGLPPMICPAHQLLRDQSALDHLLYVYRNRSLFIIREFSEQPVSEQSRVEGT